MSFPRLTAAVLLLIAGPIVSRSQQKDPPSALDSATAYDSAFRLLQSGKTAEALTAIDGALKQDPANPALYNLRGLAASELGQYDQAEASFRKFIALSPQAATGYTNLGTLFAQQGRQSEAADLFRAALKREPQSFRALLGLGVTLAALQQYAEARPPLEKAWSLEPGDFQTGYEYAHVLQQLKQPSEAEKVLARVTPPGQPTLAAKYFLLCAVLAEDEGDRKKAAQLYARVYQLDPQSFDTYLALITSFLNAGSDGNGIARSKDREVSQGLASLPVPPLHLSAEQHFTLGLLFASRRAYAAAIPHFEETLQAEPESYSAAFNLALSYKGAGKGQAAVDLVERTLKSKPTAELYNLLASLEESQGRYLDAVRNYQRAVELEPTNEQYYFDLGAEYLAHFTFGPALDVFHVGNEKFPHSLRQQLGLGFAHCGESDYLAAAQTFLTALEIDPTSPAAFAAWNSLPPLLDPMKWQEILPRLSRLAERYPQSAEALYYYGTALFQHEVTLGREASFNQAKSLLEGAVRLKPGLYEAHLELGNVYVARNEDEKAVNQFLEAIRLNPDSEMAHYRLGQTYRNLNQLQLAQQELARYTQLSRNHREVMARSRSAIKQFVLAESGKP
jgi:tetratricopeptide (TPR) repeat protein